MFKIKKLNITIIYLFKSLILKESFRIFLFKIKTYYLKINNLYFKEFYCSKRNNKQNLCNIFFLKKRLIKQIIKLYLINYFF